LKKGKKVALLLPYYEGRNHCHFLGIGYLSQVLKKAGNDTLIIDEDAIFYYMLTKATKNPLASTRNFIITKLRDYSPNVIGLTMNTTNYERSLELLTIIRENFPEIKIIVGGPHITTSWFVFKKFHSDLFDVAIVGEGEKTIVEVCEKIFSNEPLPRIKETVLSLSNNITIKQQDTINNLDCLPYPDRTGFYKIFSKDEYNIINEHYRRVFYSHLPGFKEKKFARIVCSRGCNFLCNFCSPAFIWKNPLTGKPQRRVRHPFKVVDEIEYLCNQGYEAFYFDDPTFPFKSEPNFYLNFISELRRRRLKINWAAPTRHDELSKDILEELSASGFTYTYFGLETYQKKDLIKMGKGIDIDHCLKILNWCKNTGIHCDVSYQIGLPGKDYDSIVKSIQWLEGNHLQKKSFFSIAAIWPETPLAIDYGIKSEHYEPGIDKKKLEKNGLYYYKPGNDNIEGYYSNCSGTFHFIDEETAIQVKYYLIDSGFIKRFD